MYFWSSGASDCQEKPRAGEGPERGRRPRGEAKGAARIRD